MTTEFNTIDDEEWSPVVGFEGFYEVSNLGRVRSMPRVIFRKKCAAIYQTGDRTKKAHYMANAGKIMKCTASQGYLRLNLRKDGKTHMKMVHQLVAQAFLGPCPKGQEVRHKNGKSLECDADNLEYGTRKQNVGDAFLHGTFLESRRWRVLTEAQVREIAANTTESAEVLAARYGVKRMAIQAVRMGRTWRGVTEGIRQPDYRKRRSCSKTSSLNPS